MSDKSRMADVKVGFFVLLALAVFVSGALWIAGSTFLGGQRVRYRVLMPTSGGIKTGDRVRLAGVAVGRVDSVTLSNDKEYPVVFQIALESDITLRQDAKARLASRGILGSNFLQVHPGSTDAPVLSPGGEFYGEPKLSMEQIMSRVDDISAKVVGVLEQTHSVMSQVSAEIGPILQKLELMLAEENSENLRGILATLRKTLDESGPRLNDLLARLDSAAENLDEGLEGMPELAAKISSLVSNMETALGPDGSRLAGLLDAGQSSLNSADQVLGVINENRDHLDATLQDLRDTAANMKVFSQQIKERPSSLIRIKAPPDRQPGDDTKGGSQ